MKEYRMRLGALLCALAMVLALVSAVFVLGHAEHECEGTQCGICAQIAAAVNGLRADKNQANLRPAAAAVGFYILLAVFVPVLLTLRTLVSLKVQMNH